MGVLSGCIELWFNPNALVEGVMNGFRIQAPLYCVALSAFAVTLYDSQMHRAGAISFHINSSDSVPAWAIDRVAEASTVWSSSFTDDVTVTLDLHYAPLEEGVLGYTDVAETIYDYQDVYRALSLDSFSAYDASAIQHLPQGGTIPLLINHTSDHPLGYGSPVPYLDNDGGSNNQRLRLTHANAKALDLFAPNADERLQLSAPSTVDATITLNSSVRWDIDRTDGIASDAYDFLGVAAHEIGHALGFVSGTDLLDEASPFSVNGIDFFFPEDTFSVVSSLDLFRFSEESVSYGAGVIDWTADARDKYFSINGGRSPVQGMPPDGTLIQPALFSTGTNRGDGNSNSHWKTGLNLGLMQPRLESGTLLDLTPLDSIALDVIGWDPSESFVQAPGASSTLPAPSVLQVDGTPTEGSIERVMPSKAILASRMMIPEVAIATASGEPPPDFYQNPSPLAIRSAGSATPTEIPESRSALGMVAAIALFGTCMAKTRRCCSRG